MEQCSYGFRTSKLMQRFGINQDNFEYFRNEIYQRCELLEISPDQIGNLLNEIIKLSKIVYPSQIPTYIKKQKRRINRNNQ